MGLESSPNYQLCEFGCCCELMPEGITNGKPMAQAACMDNHQRWHTFDQIPDCSPTNCAAKFNTKAVGATTTTINLETARRRTEESGVEAEDFFERVQACIGEQLVWCHDWYIIEEGKILPVGAIRVNDCFHWTPDQEGEYQISLGYTFDVPSYIERMLPEPTLNISVDYCGDCFLIAEIADENTAEGI